MHDAPDSQAITVVTKDSFPEFIHAPHVLVHVAPRAEPRLAHWAIKIFLDTSIAPPVRFGVIDLSKVEWTLWTQLYVAARLPALGLSPDPLGRPPPGFYLFSWGTTRGFHPVTIDLQHDGDLVQLGAVAAFVGRSIGVKDYLALGLDVASMRSLERVAEWTKQRVQANP
jgi:hypothetical protein